MTNERYTFSGSPTIESKLRELLAEIASRARDLDCLRVADGLILIGGYGRGEGGVEQTEQGEQLHNNLDLLLVTRLKPTSERVREFMERFDEELQMLRAIYGVGLDASAVNWAHLSRTRGTLMGYDARHGHRVVVGQRDLLGKMSPYLVKHIDPSQIEDLVVNRGTLLIINRVALRGQEDCTIESPLGHMLVKHAMKATIGYGDAWLYHRGLYDWSYVEKLRRMTQFAHIAPWLARHYIEAGSFRLQPDYRSLNETLDKESNRQLIHELARVHSEFANQPHSPRSAVWTGELHHRLQRESQLNWSKPRQCLGTILRAAKHMRDSRTSRMQSRLRVAGLGPRRWLRLAFPYVAYGLGTTEEREALAVLLGASPRAAHDERAMDEAYLTLWSRYGDSNFRHLLAQLAQPMAGVES